MSNKKVLTFSQCTFVIQLLCIIKIYRVCVYDLVQYSMDIGQARDNSIYSCLQIIIIFKTKLLFIFSQRGSTSNNVNVPKEDFVPYFVWRSGMYSSTAFNCETQELL